MTEENQASKLSAQLYNGIYLGLNFLYIGKAIPIQACSAGLNKRGA